MNHKTTRRYQKYNLKLLKIAIDAQKNEDCCSQFLTIKNGSNPVFEPNILAGVEGLEPSRTVLETGMLPLHHTPKERHIKFLLCSICNIGTQLWRPLFYQLNYTPVFCFPLGLVFTTKVKMSIFFCKNIGFLYLSKLFDRVINLCYNKVKELIA